MYRILQFVVGSVGLDCVLQREGSIAGSVVLTDRATSLLIVGRPPIIELWRGGRQLIVCATVLIQLSTAGRQLVYI